MESYRDTGVAKVGIELTELTNGDSINYLSKFGRADNTVNKQPPEICEQCV